MSFFRSALNMFTGLFTRSNNTQPHQQVTACPASARQVGGLIGEDLGEKPTKECKLWLNSLERPGKRKATDDHDISPSKRAKSVHQIHSDCASVLAPKGTYTLSNMDARPNTKYTHDRALMPPPATPLNRKTPSKHTKQSRGTSSNTLDTSSETNSHVTRHTETDNDYDMEAARRRAAATQLPANSGFWETAEKDLFFHLAYRGFEPLLPSTWMTDFRTLPLSLFATRPDQVPLIQSHKSTEFRAIKALSDLIETGKNVRDRALSPKRKLRKEPLIEKAATKYIKWAVEDIGVARKEVIPVHAIAAMKKGQSTLDTIRELTVKMHKLSARHREASDVLASVELHETSHARNDTETHLLRDPGASEQRLPVIYGLMVCSSLLAVFTLSSHTPPPRFIARRQSGDSGDDTDDDDDDDDDDDNEDSGLRFIHSFDFSDSASDVWNAFVIAIVAMEIRKSLAEIHDIDVLAGGQEDEESWIESSVVDGDGPRDRVGNEKAVTSTSVVEEHDPDL